MPIFSSVAPAGGGVSGFTRLDILTSSGTWTHPDGATAENPLPVYIIAIGGGGSGGSGAGQGQYNSSSYLSNMVGGGGGGGAGMIEAYENLVYAPVTVTIGAGGSARGGPSSDGSTAVGNIGNAGGNTSFGSNVIDSQVRIPILARGGSGGAGGLATTTSSGQSWWRFPVDGGNGSSIGGQGIVAGAPRHQQGYSSGGHNAGFPHYLSAAGGGGGGIAVADSTTGVARFKLTSGALGGVSFTGLGGAGGAAVLDFASGGNIVGGAGGNATAAGGGGGGGGAGGNTASFPGPGVGGTGGAGAAGRIYVYY